MEVQMKVHAPVGEAPWKLQAAPTQSAQRFMVERSLDQKCPGPAAPRPKQGCPQTIDYQCERTGRHHGSLEGAMVARGCDSEWADVEYDDGVTVILSCVLCGQVMRPRIRPQMPAPTASAPVSPRFPSGRCAGKTVAEAMAEGEAGQDYVRWYAENGRIPGMKDECIKAVKEDE
jgi:ribosomal protein S14